jgi:putative aminopeptidase FrvX
VDNTEQFLQALTDAHGVPGYEAEVRAVLREYMTPWAT